MSDDELDRGPVDRGRKTFTSTLHIGEHGRSVDGEMNFISGDVDIEIGGAPEEGGDVLALVEDIEDAVESAVEGFEATEYDDATE